MDNNNNKYRVKMVDETSSSSTNNNKSNKVDEEEDDTNDDANKKHVDDEIQLDDLTKVVIRSNDDEEEKKEKRDGKMDQNRQEEEKAAADHETTKSKIPEFVRDSLEIFFSWLARSTAHGFAKLVFDGLYLFVRLLWLLAILVAWILLISQIIDLYSTYYKYVVDSYLTIGYEAPTYFPAIDICNLNGYDGNETRRLMLEILREKNLTFSDAPSLLKYIDMANSYFKSEFENRSKSGQLDIYQAGFLLKQMLIYCEYQAKPCNYSDFYMYHDYTYGNCFRFNGDDPNQIVRDMNNEVIHEYKSRNKLRLSSRPGKTNGLRLEMYVGDPDTQEQFTYENGIRVIIHNQSIVPLPSDQGIDVPTGFQTNIAVSRNFINKLPKPYSNCLESLNDENSYKNNRFIDEIKRMISANLMVEYQQDICLKLCHREFYYSECGCIGYSLLMLEPNKNLKRCSTAEELDCFDAAYMRYFNTAELKKCYEQCPISCHRVHYETKITQSSYPTKWYAGLFNQTYKFKNFTAFYGNKYPSYELIKSTTLVVNIYYDSVTYSVIDETPHMPFDMLLSSIGGLLGLFTGSSLLTFVEYADLLIVLSFFFLFKYKNGLVRDKLKSLLTRRKRSELKASAPPTSTTTETKSTSTSTTLKRTNNSEKKS